MTAIQAPTGREFVEPIPLEDSGSIAKVQAFHIAVPSDYGGPPPRRARQWPLLNQLFVRVETDQGLIGWGEAFGHGACAVTKQAIETLVAPLCVGSPVRAFARLGADLRRKLFAYGPGGAVAFAVSGVEIALWDIAAKSRGVPVCRMLAPGVKLGRVPAYASLLRYDDADLVGMASADAVSRGHHAVKLHEATLECVAAAREAVGPHTPLALDVNCRWGADEAAEIAERLVPFDLAWIEEPCWPPDPEHLARIGKASKIAMAAGENAGSLAELENIAVVGRAAFLQPSVTKIGGIGALLAAAGIARRHGARIATHSAYFGPGLLATLQFCAAFGLDCEWYDCRLEAHVGGITPENGAFVLPEIPGLGREPDMDAIRQFGVT